MSCLEICTCQAHDCPVHPKNHDNGCTPCIEKNLKHHEIPACFWYKIGDTENANSDYTFHNFAQKVIDCEANKEIKMDRGFVNK